ncbi:hypothetical protein [Nocardia seriolae]|uniref:hypothetical protein n=1 Tax=Nocardia seriolae TaxID=37332 RepID=UPI0011AB2F9F|nr:hypothetical protein [Nocardia seriolae]MTJ64667.1 hypothetical protein [Nocardia seriolae]MTJ73022.1 hypothetical protein [Nocardia seriolae]MTJ89510.1 hypothetical protein [Nocardia seriolae]MTK33485.1 hypothetical protein [Nocardia seriolae]MTK42625.1 hypothetical protein [Nocardia seriolae]
MVDELTTAALRRSSILPWAKALDLKGPQWALYGSVIDAVLRRVVDDDVIIVPEPGTLRINSHFRDPLTEDTIAFLFGFEAYRTQRLITSSPEPLMFADHSARPERGVDAVVALLRTVSDIMRAPRYL